MSLHNSKLIQTILDSKKGAKFAKDLQARTRGTIRGTVVDVEDPLNQGRVKVVFDSKEGAEVSYQSEWIPVQMPFNGNQPPSLIGLRVNITPTDGDMQKAVVSDVIMDEKSLGYPVNTTMTRLPVYPSGGLPSATKENLGCMIIEQGGPNGWDYICVCLGRSSKYYWVRLSHFDHIHGGADDVPPTMLFTPPSPLPGEWARHGVVWDRVLATTDKEYERKIKTNYGDDGRGTDAKWLGSAE